MPSVDIIHALVLDGHTGWMLAEIDRESFVADVDPTKSIRMDNWGGSIVRLGFGTIRRWISDSSFVVRH